MIGGRVVGIDISRWQPAVNWKVLKEGGVDFVIVKATQGNYTVDSMFASHVDGAKSVGIPVGAYHWCDPLVDTTAQADYFLNLIYSVGVDFCAADIEQQWADWSEWSKRSITKLIAPDRISEDGRRFVKQVEEESKKNVLVYTRATFVQGYARPMYSWMVDKPLWYAVYPYASGVVRLGSWADIPFPINPMWFPNGYGAELRDAKKIDRLRTWRVWQFSGDKFILPGLGDTKVDLNLWAGGLDDMRRFAKIGGNPGNPSPEPTLESRVARLEEEARQRGWSV